MADYCRNAAVVPFFKCNSKSACTFFRIRKISELKINEWLYLAPPYLYDEKYEQDK